MNMKKKNLKNKFHVSLTVALTLSLTTLWSIPGQAQTALPSSRCQDLYLEKAKKVVLPEIIQTAKLIAINAVEAPILGVKAAGICIGEAVAWTVYAGRPYCFRPDAFDNLKALNKKPIMDQYAMVASAIAQSRDFVQCLQTAETSREVCHYRSFYFKKNQLVEDLTLDLFKQRSGQDTYAKDQARMDILVSIYDLDQDGHWCADAQDLSTKKEVVQDIRQSL